MEVNWGPALYGVRLQFVMASMASVVTAAALKLDRKDVHRRMMVHASCLTIEIKPVNFCLADEHPITSSNFFVHKCCGS